MCKHLVDDCFFGNAKVGNYKAGVLFDVQVVVVYRQDCSVGNIDVFVLCAVDVQLGDILCVIPVAKAHHRQNFCFGAFRKLAILVVQNAGIEQIEKHCSACCRGISQLIFRFENNVVGTDIATLEVENFRAFLAIHKAHKFGVCYKLFVKSQDVLGQFFDAKFDAVDGACKACVVLLGNQLQCHTTCDGGWSCAVAGKFAHAGNCYKLLQKPVLLLVEVVRDVARIHK